MGMLEDLEQKYRLPTGYLSRTKQIESGGRPRAVSPTGASGDFQFTKGTARQYGLSLEDRFDPVKSADAAARLGADNMSILRKALNRDPSGGELYMAHQQGGGGAAKLLTNMNAPAGSLVPANNVVVNSGDPNAPASSLINKFIDKYNNVKPGDNHGQGPTVAAAAQPPAAVPAAPAQPPSAFGADKGLIGMLNSPDGITGDGLKSFLGGAEMKGATAGLGMLAKSLGDSGGPATPAPQQLTVEENRPDMSLMQMLLPKRKRMMV